jgi:hypothetical protein
LAAAVTRLARLTGGPNQSPAWFVAAPNATPTRTCGKRSPFSSTDEARSTTEPSSGSTFGETNMAASPTVLTILAGRLMQGIQKV